MSDYTLVQRFKGCMMAGAVGDAWGSSFENEQELKNVNTFFWGGKKETERKWIFTDDTQLTMATCEALAASQRFEPSLLAQHFLRYHKEKRLTGIGASTLKALNDLDAGADWNQAGRMGEYAAGNGAAMRIAPFAFFEYISREDIRNACRITHRNDEAYVGALAIVLSLKAAINNSWTGTNNLFDLIIPELPDTNVRDRLIELNNVQNKVGIDEVAKKGTNGYVVNAVPFAVFAASKVMQIGIEEMFEAIIGAGGDTDTNASMAGQVAGCLLGADELPEKLLIKIKHVYNYDWVETIVNKTAGQLS